MFILLIFGFILLLSACDSKVGATMSKSDNAPTIITTLSDDNTDITKDDELDNMKLTLKIDNQEVEVYWFDNPSVNAL